ncbi:MAG: TonB-dependent receptor [Gemmatimonadetes bacterium]|nr:TonB-dependent receptor [Gemmatimonadota bacterium]
MTRIIPAWVALLLAFFAAPLAAQHPPELHGRVTERGSGAPVPGAVVEVAGSGARAVAGPDGGFALRGLPPGQREVQVRAFGYLASTHQVVLANGRRARLSVALQPHALVLGEVRVTAERQVSGGTVLDRARIEASGAAELGELLRDEAGVVVTRRGGPGAPAQVSIRGSGADEVLVLVDGVPINSLLTGEADLSTVPLEAVERVTVLRGAQSARYGERALAGAILVESRRPAGAELGARLGGGSLGERSAGASAGARAHAGSTALDGLVVAEWRAARGGFGYAVPAVAGGGTAVRRNADVAGWSVAATGAAVRGAMELRARAEGGALERGMPGSIVQSAPHARQSHDRRSAHLGASGRLGALGWTLGLDAARQRARFRDPDPPFGAAYDDEMDVGTAGASASATALLSGAVLVAGMDARRTGFASTLLAADAPTSRTLAGAWASGRLSRRLAGLQLELSPGARLDHDASRRGAFLSAKVGASATASGWTARVSAGNAYSPPSLGDQFFQEGVMVRPNPDLRPERVRAEVEGGLSFRDLLLGGVSLDGELAAYRADVDGMILWSPDHRFVWSPANFDVRRRGGEASVQARFRGAEVRASASHAAVEYRTPTLSGQVMYRPRWTLSGGAAATVAGARADLSVRHVGQRRTVENPRINLLPPHTLVDARFTRKWAASWGAAELSLSVENALDRSAAMLLDYPYPPRSWSVDVRLYRNPRPSVARGPSPDQHAGDRS